MACHDVPIVLRATHLDYVPPHTARLAAIAAERGSTRVFAVGCWDGSIPLGGGAWGVGLGRHVACRDWWREANLRNVRGRARLGPLQPMWGAVELLTAAALELPLVLPNCRREAQRQSGPGCVAFVADPDVLLSGRSVRDACAYYNASRYDAVLLGAPPRRRLHTLDPHVFNASAIPELMVNRHVSFLTPRAMGALVRLTREALPTYDLDKGADMLMPNLLPTAPEGLEVLWLLDGCGFFVRPGGHCTPRRLRHLDDDEAGRARGREAAGGGGSYACTALLDDHGAAPAALHGTQPPRACPLSAAAAIAADDSIAMWDAFVYMIAHERPSRHVCEHVHCLPPASQAVAARRRRAALAARRDAIVRRDDPAQLLALRWQRCLDERGPYRYMPLLDVRGDGVRGRRRSGGGGGGMRLLSVHFQGNAKGACLEAVLGQMQLMENGTGSAATAAAAAVAARTFAGSMYVMVNTIEAGAAAQPGHGQSEQATGTEEDWVALQLAGEEWEEAYSRSRMRNREGKERERRWR